jgi:plasmid stabilization system protein ParE
MNRLYIEPEAEAELEEAAAQYEDAVPGLGMRFLAEMRQRVRDALEAPTSFPRFGDAHDVRCAHAVGQFPHLVVYMLVGDESRQTVHVLAFMHPRQRPGYWMHRRPR